MIAEIEYELNGVPKKERYDFGGLVVIPDIAGIEYRFHQRMQLKKQYQCFDNELTEVCYKKRYDPSEYRLKRITLHGDHSNWDGPCRKVYDHFSDFETPTVVRKAKPQAPQQSELNV